MRIPPLIPYYTEILDLPMPAESAERLLEISSDPKNENASLATNKSPDGSWLLVRRPGMISNLFLIVGRVNVQEADPGASHAEVAIGIQPLVVVFMIFVFCLISISMVLFIELEWWLVSFLLGARAAILVPSMVFEDRFLRKSIRKMLTFDP